ncbi:MAG: prolyl oligopeptidase family serine peptidase [Pirellulaceae bacterium]
MKRNRIYQLVNSSSLGRAIYRLRLFYCLLPLAAGLALFFEGAPCRADDAATLRLSWENNLLTIHGDHLPGKSLVIWYLEAYCRPGSTNRDWGKTVIPHHTELVSASDDGHQLRLRCTISDGVVVDHVITATHDEIDFRIAAHNPTQVASEVEWAQPCIRVDKFTGRNQQTYLGKCFVFLDDKLERFPTQDWATQAFYTPGQTWAAPGIDRKDVNPRPLNEHTPSKGLIGCFSEDESMILANAFEPYQELFQGIITCIHSDFRIGGLSPGETKHIRGKLYIVPSDVDALLERYHRDFPEQSHHQASLDGENEDTPWSDMQQFFEAPAEYQAQLGDYRSLLTFDTVGKKPVETAEDWKLRREEIRDYWQTVTGRWPELLEQPRIKYLTEEHVENFTRHTVEVEVAKDEFVGPLYLLVPDGPGPFPAVIVTWYNSADSAGLTEKSLGTRDFGIQLARRGFVTLCLGATNGVDVHKPDHYDSLQPLTYLAYTAANSCNLLANMPQVRANRIGIIGHSYGGKWAMFASCLYDKFACAVWSDPGIVWNELDPSANYWEPWYLGNDFDRPADQQRPPGLVTSDNPRSGAYRTLLAEHHNLHELHALMAPRPFLVSGGAQDRPDHWTALNHTVAVNTLLGYTDRVGMTMRDGHSPTAESNRQAYSFLEHFLKPDSR